MQCDTLAFLPHPTDITDIAPPPRPFASVRFDPLAWSSGSDQRRISGCGIRWLLAGPDSLPLWLCCVCAFVLLRCFSCSHTVLPKEHSLGIIFFSSLSSCKCCIFLQFYLHFTTDYTCMIVYVTNNKEPWTLTLNLLNPRSLCRQSAEWQSIISRSSSALWECKKLLTRASSLSWMFKYLPEMMEKWVEGREGGTIGPPYSCSPVQSSSGE